jgi:transcription elongation factor GreA
MAVSYMTQDGYNKLQKEIEHLETVERPRISQQIAEARDKGDLSENAEYDAAKEAQGMLEMKISQLKELFLSARILDESKINTDTVQILTTVTMVNIKTKQTLEYTIVSDSEANLKEKKISVSTPIAKGLLGKKLGDVVDIPVPAGVLSLQIKNIQLAK